MAKIEAPVGGGGSSFTVDLTEAITEATGSPTAENYFVCLKYLNSLLYIAMDVSTLEGTEFDIAGGWGPVLAYAGDTDTFYYMDSGETRPTVDHLFILEVKNQTTYWFRGVAGRYVVNGTQIREVIAAATGPLTEAQVRGTIINNYGQGAENTQTLPAAKAGLGFSAVVMTTGAGALHFKPATGEQVVLDGVLLDANHKVRLAAPALGDTFRALCLQYGASSWRWVFSTSQGTYDDGAE